MPRISQKRKPQTGKRTTKPKAHLQERYWEAVGRRKTAVARVRIKNSKTHSFLVNGKPGEAYFQDPELSFLAKQSLQQGAPDAKFEISVLVQGGGKNAQAQAVRHGVARALVERDASLKTRFKALHFLTRDPRMRERKKFGLKRARRARQWRKR